jgi:rhodanese-related sulfurtransferase
MDTAPIAPLSLFERFLAPDAPLVLDVRREPAYGEDDRMVMRALRPEGDLAGFARAHAAGRDIVVYCVKGAEVGHEAAQALRDAGLPAVHLEGGLRAWKAAGLPRFRRQEPWRVPGGSRWITRERPKIDRVACPWLVLRFLDPLARFDYVPREQVFEAASARGAVPYDIPGAQLSHRGERCSFDAFLEDFALEDEALGALATIVRGADTGRHELAPECAGLAAASLGLSRRHPDDDHAMLREALPLYDALYAECLARVRGEREVHTWSA